LDLVVTKEFNVIDTMTTQDPLGKSDHLYLEFEYIYSVIYSYLQDCEAFV